MCVCLGYQQFAERRVWKVGREMFTRTIKVPKVTVETLAAIELIAPGLPALTNMKLIHNDDQALAIATAKVERGLVKYECISHNNPPIITKTSEGWSFLFTIFGD